MKRAIMLAIGFCIALSIVGCDSGGTSGPDIGLLGRWVQDDTDNPRIFYFDIKNGRNVFTEVDKNGVVVEWGEWNAGDGSIYITSQRAVDANETLDTPEPFRYGYSLSEGGTGLTISDPTAAIDDIISFTRTAWQ